MLKIYKIIYKKKIPQIEIHTLFPHQYHKVSHLTIRKYALNFGYFVQEAL